MMSISRMRSKLSGAIGQLYMQWIRMCRDDFVCGFCGGFSRCFLADHEAVLYIEQSSTISKIEPSKRERLDGAHSDFPDAPVWIRKQACPLVAGPSNWMATAGEHVRRMTSVVSWSRACCILIFVSSAHSYLSTSFFHPDTET